VSTTNEKYIKIFFDGGSRGNPGPSAAAFIAYDSNGKKIAQDSVFLGTTTNNISEYKGLLLALEYLKRQKIKKIVILTDSKLVYSQVRGLWKVKNEKITPLVAKARQELLSYEAVDLRLISREENREADKLVNKELDSSSAVNEKINFSKVADNGDQEQLDFD
jgi:ribonuclease HI